MTIQAPAQKYRNGTNLYTGVVFLATCAFSILFVLSNYLNFNWLSPGFEATNPTVWGIVQRLFIFIPVALISLWRPRQIGFQVGKIKQHWRMLAIMLAANVAVMAAYRILAGATPYTDNSMLINEVITVPVVEEFMWRGVVFAALLVALRRVHPEAQAGILAAWFSGICFGLIHANNAFFGYPLAFVGLQTLNATIWGVVYGIARAKTGSVWPSFVFHAAMNLVVAVVL